jgi:endo-alpha-1,4-polygalactosaminidase (GH114 family)
MNPLRITSILIAVLSVAGCASKPLGPKLFDGVYPIVTADRPITVPPDLPKNFVDTVRARAVAITQSEIAKQGDFTTVEACGAKVMKVTQEITEISMSQNLVASRSFFSGSVSQDTKQQVSISTTLKLEDCHTGKLIYSYDYTSDGSNPTQVLQDLISYNVYLAYYNRYQR